MLKKLKHFMHAHVYRAEEELEAHAITAERWSVSPIVESLKRAAKMAGLWNLWLPIDSAALLKIRAADGKESALFCRSRIDQSRVRASRRSHGSERVGERGFQLFRTGYG